MVEIGVKVLSKEAVVDTERAVLQEKIKDGPLVWIDQREKKEDNGQRQSNRNCYGNQRPYYRSRYYSNYRNDVKYDGRREHEKRNYPRKSLQKPSGNYYNPLLRNYHDCESNYDPRGRNQYEARLIHHL